MRTEFQPENTKAGVHFGGIIDTLQDNIKIDFKLGIMA
jgi:hypothetical protein